MMRDYSNAVRADVKGCYLSAWGMKPNKPASARASSPLIANFSLDVGNHAT